jgi:hypothetical protein
VSTGNWLCAYAITRNRPSTLDIGPVPRLIGYRDLGVVVSEVAPARFDRIDTLDPVDGTLAELAREHDAVVRAVFRREPVLPLRFGTVLDGEDAARRLLEAGYDQARDCLEEVAGHREWGVRIRHTEPAATTRPDATGLTGTQYLVRRRDRRKALQGRHAGSMKGCAATRPTVWTGPGRTECWRTRRTSWRPAGRRRSTRRSSGSPAS